MLPVHHERHFAQTLHHGVILHDDFGFVPAQGQPGRWFALVDEGLRSYRYKNGEWHDEGFIPDLVAVRYRKRKIPMDDVVTLCEGLRRAAASAAEPNAEPAIDASIDAAISMVSGTARSMGITVEG